MIVDIDFDLDVNLNINSTIDVILDETCRRQPGRAGATAFR